MKINRSSKNWLIDAALFGGFIALFFLELTGVVLHQWLGIAAGALAAYHLLAHWDWVAAVVERLLGRATWKARLYLLVDILLAAGFITIVLSGVVISTWLNLRLGEAYLALSTFHVLVSQGTLLLIVCKIALHGEWIVKTARRLVSRPEAPRAGRLAPAPVAVPARPMRRRDVLRLMGVTGLAAAGALARTRRPIAETLAGWAEAAPVEAESLPAAEPASATSAPVMPEVQATASPSATETPAPSATVALPTPTIEATRPAATPTAQPTAQPALCTKLCPRGFSCSYPGRCRSYRDRNGNGHCDLAEC